MVIRFSKIALLAIIALNLTVVSVNNVTDYDSNYEFVKNILNMSTTYPDNDLMWRKIESPIVWNIFYLIIIIWEIFIAIFCYIGIYKLLKNIKSPETEFNKAKKFAFIGLVLSMFLYGFAFITVGGEWFLMWQSDKWNAEIPALKMFLMSGVTLLFLNQKES